MSPIWATKINRFSLPSTFPSSLSQGDVFTGWMLGWTGVIFQHSQLRIAEITDGTSQTYLLGEKTIDPDYYFDGLEYGDNWELGHGAAGQHLSPGGHGKAAFALVFLYVLSTYTGHPRRLRLPRLGSAHPYSLNMTFCDGSVRRQLFDRPRDPSPAGQPGRWPDRQRQAVLTEL